VKIRQDDGVQLDVGPVLPSSGRPVTVTVTDSLSRVDFGCCPICFHPSTTDEHVPPESIGGRVMTLTCDPCNHRLASRVERDLADWIANKYPRVWLKDGDGKQRRLPNVQLLVTDAGEFVVASSGNSKAAASLMVPKTTVTLIAEGPDQVRWRIALMKHAYLAHCIAYGITDDLTMTQVRNDLINARDSARREQVHPSKVADSMLVMRTGQRAERLASIVVAQAEHEDGCVEGVILAGQVFVSWPSADGPSRRRPEQRSDRVSVGLTLGYPVGGVIL
jgi:hypothetical protein